MAVKSFKRVQAKTARVALSRQVVDDDVFRRFGVTRQYVEEMEKQFQGRIELPGMPGYDTDRQGNPLYPAFPKMIAYCANAHDVALALNMARDHGWKGLTTCRAGGHSTAGYSVNDWMVIDVSLMDDVVIDPNRRLMTVGAGANWGRINAKLNLYQLHVPGGGCENVGVAGYMQGGGYGFTSREYGMNCDNVVQATVMLASGDVVVANKQKNIGLFWAVRGGTGNQFGVVLEIVYGLHDLYDVWGFSIQWPLTSAAAPLAEMQANYMKTGAPATLGYQTFFSTVEETPQLVMLGMFHGSRGEGRLALDALLKTPGAHLEEHPGTYGRLNEGLLDILTHPLDELLELKRSAYIGTPLGVEGWNALIEGFAATPNKYNLVGFEPYGGAINAYPAHDSAFIHRNVYADFFVDSFFDTAGKITTRETAGEWLARMMSAVEPYQNGHVYQNYPERDLPNYRFAYWGDALPTLQQVKRAYDPESFFLFGQSVAWLPTDLKIAGPEAAGRFPGIEVQYESYSRVLRETIRA
jgi:FAD/FMN-containing dehydrogenase